MAQTATNPETGETVVWDGSSWVPAQTATNPETQQKMALVDNQWTPIGGVQAPQAQPATPYGQQVSQRFNEMDNAAVVKGAFPEYQKRVEGLERTYETPYGQETLEASPSDKILVAASEGVRRLGQVAVNYANVIIPDFVRDEAKAEWQKFSESETGEQVIDAVSKGFATYQEFAEENPEAAERFESYVDVSAMLVPQLNASAKASKAALKMKGKRNQFQLDEFQTGIERMMTPPDMEGPGEVILEGFLGRKKYIPSEFEDTVNLSIGTVEGVNPKRSYTWNAWKVNDAIKESNEELMGFLKKNNTEVPLDDFTEEIGEHLMEFAQTEDFMKLTNEAQKKAQDFSDKVLAIVDAKAKGGKVLATDLLDIRREFDSFLNGGSARVFDPTVESAKSVAGRHIRGFLNDKLKSITPGDEVHYQLDRMHHLLSGMDRLKQGRKAEMINGPLRLWSRIKDVTNLPSTPLALYATFATAGAAGAAMAPQIATASALGATAYTVALAMSKATRLKVYKQLLSASEKAIKIYENDANMVRKIKADRALVLELMRDTQKAPEETEE